MNSTLIQPHHSASKLPIKRKNPDSDSDQIEGRGALPFKFHRIWTEPDEIRFLQGLLECSSQSLLFPRDLGIFYARFSDAMSQPYTKSQLSEKLRRLRKKFRVISDRLSKALDRSHLSLHDRALYDLSKRLWHPDYAATSPFGAARNGVSDQSNGNDDSVRVDEKIDRSNLHLVRVKVDFSPNLPLPNSNSNSNSEFDQQEDNPNCANYDLHRTGGFEGGRVGIRGFCNKDDKNDARLSEVNVEFERGGGSDTSVAKIDPSRIGIGAGNSVDSAHENQIREITAKVAVNAFDHCFNDVRRSILARPTFQLRWQQQRIAELDALGSRLRLVLEQSLEKH